MTPTPTQREQVRLSILRYTQTQALSENLIRSYLNAEGLPLDAGQVSSEVQYLADKGLLTSHEKTISPEVRMWRATAAGRDYLAMQGLE